MLVVNRVLGKGQRILGDLESRLLSPWRTKVLLLNYTARQANWGCQATSAGLMKLIHQGYGSADIAERHIRFVKSPDEYDLPTSPLEWNYYLERACTSQDFERFSWADVIIVNGEGSIHEWDNMRERPEPYLRLLEVYAAQSVFNKPVMAVNQTVDYWSDDFGQWVKGAFQSCDYVSVREPRSLARLLSLGLDHVSLVPDAAFLTNSVTERDARSFLSEKGIEEGYMALFLGESVAEVDIDKLYDLVWRAQRERGNQLVLFAAPAVDAVVARELQFRVGLRVVGLEARPEMLVGILSLASMVMSGRFHCCIFAALAGTPLVPLRSNTDKVEGLMELMEYPLPVLDYQEADNDQVLSAMEAAAQRRKELQQLLSRRVPELRAITQLGYPNLLKVR